jgi:Tol biopolymer transport system component
MQAINATNNDLNSYAAQIALSDTGLLAYVPGGSYPDLKRMLARADRRGSVQMLTTREEAYFAPRITRDDKRIIYTTLGGLRDIWIYDVQRGISTRIANGGMNLWPIWHPDGRRATYVVRD